MSVPNLTNSANFGSRVMALVIDSILLEIIHFLLFILLARKFLQVVYIEPLTMLTFFVLSLSVFSVSFLFLHMAFLPFSMPVKARQ